MARTKISEVIQSHVLVKSRRRCCICYGLNRDTGLKNGQIAHLDHDSSNSREENLAFLCLDHHDEFDSKSSQRKGLTVSEVRQFRAELHEAIGKAFTQQVHFGEMLVPAADPCAGQWVRIGTGSDSAEIVITPLPDGPDGYPRYFISGEALWGTDRAYGPNLGFLGFVSELREPGRLNYVRPNGNSTARTFLTFEPTGRLNVQEQDWLGAYGMNVSFAGKYERSSPPQSAD